jgi:hypothetical protein
MKLPAFYHKLTVTERRIVRERYVELQQSMCAHCKSSLLEDPPAEILSKRIRWSAFPPMFLNWPVHLHHSHETGMTIGAVHAYCNAVLWQYHGE